jgi:uncharacterized protein YdaU (DUF1376 family)
MNKAPAFQFYANDWLSSTRIALMTPAQEGAYIRLLCYAWNDPDCSIPDDDQTLSTLSRLGEGWFNGGSQMVRNCFEPHPTKPGRLVNSRLLEERSKQDEWREKSRQGGIKSGQSRRRSGKTLIESTGENSAGETKGGSQMVRRVVEPKGNSSSSSSSSCSSLDPPSEDLESRSRSRSSRSRRPQICDKEWLKELQAKPAYQALNVAMIYAKMEAWCEVKGKQPTRARFINWLNREDLPMSVNGNVHSGPANAVYSRSPSITEHNRWAGEEARKILFGEKSEVIEAEVVNEPD